MHVCCRTEGAACNTVCINERKSGKRENVTWAKPESGDGSD